MQASLVSQAAPRVDWSMRNGLWLVLMASLAPNLIGSLLNIGYNLIHFAC